MNEQQKIQTQAVQPKEKIKKKDYSKYFEAPSLKDAKKRGKTEVQYHNDFKIPEEFIGFGTNRKFHIRTYGCQMNEHDTEVMSGILIALGYEPTPTWDDADVVLLNTCAIRENAENRVFGELGHLVRIKRNNPDLLIVVCGCMSQEEEVVNKILRKYSHVDMIFGTHNIHRLPFILRDAHMSKERVIEVWSKEGDIIENLPKVRRDNIKAWVNIMYGCDKFCTYCIVPYTRGKERSRLPEDIIAEVKDLIKQGYQEITLLGQNVNAYGKDFEDREYRLGNLMEEIAQLNIPRIRFTTSYPSDFDDHLISVIAKYDNIMNHIHLPVQSGSNPVLKIMARKYTREKYLELVSKIKAQIPDVSFTTDIIVGYPNETEEQFLETMDLYEKVGYEHAFTFVYSPREGTPAAKMVDNVSQEEKKERLQRLNRLANSYSANTMAQYKDKIVNVLVEGESKNNPDILAGYTEKLKLVNFKAPKELIGKIVPVKITDVRTWSLMGELVEEHAMQKVEA